MDVIVSLRFIVPIGMRILIERYAFSNDVFEMIFPSVAALVRSQAIEHRLIGGLLHFYVQRGVDLETSLVNLIGSVFRFQVAADFFNEIWREGVRIMREMQRHGLGSCSVRLRSRDLPVFEQGIDNQVTALDGAIGMVDRRVNRRALRQSREQGGF